MSRPKSRPAKKRKSAPVPRAGKAYALERVFTVDGRDPYETVRWETRTARITDADGRIVFEQKGVETPASWSQLATDLVASRYFAGIPGSPGRERSVQGLVRRVASTIAGYVRLGRYLGSAREVRVFEDELTWLLLHQRAAFNSPVWFNVGIDTHVPPQVSACFIVGLQDDLGDILELARIEGRVFSKGSGAGTNFSRLRGSKEPMRSGGCASGPVAFLRGLDALAGAVKSGGRTRRAAKMALLDADHPDVLDFVRSKAEEEERARALADAGLLSAGDVARDAVVGFQNENHSVRVTDAFLEAAESDGPWRLVPRTKEGRPETIRARDLLRAAAAAAHACGDPGLQYADTIERWNPVPRTGPIRASNPCSEFVFVDDTACNLASINVMAFRDAAGDLDVPALRAAVRVLLLAMEALVSRASYPTAAIARNSERLRPLGLGLANVGSLLLARALPYDSDAGRGLAAGLAALVGGEASACSAELAARKGPFAEWAKNRDPALAVLRRHRDAARALAPEHVPAPLLAAVRASWDRALALASKQGLRNAQVSCIAPTGTISFLMDCDTTGIEPELSLVKEKKLVGGGRLRLGNRSLPEAFARLGYSPTQAEAILAHVERTGVVEGAPGLREEDLPVFDTAVPSRPGGRSLSAAAHLAMMAAVQPFVSGAISKTVNLPADATVDDVERIFRSAWRLGLKAVAVYRDRSKVAQPLAPGRGAGKGRSPSRRHAPVAEVAWTEAEGGTIESESTAPGDRCPTCASEMVPGGACLACPNCGAATSCG